MSLIGRHVRFAIKDIYHPAPAAVLSELHAGDVLSGHVVDESDSGLDADAFLVVKIDGLERPIVILVQQVRESQGG